MNASRSFSQSIHENRVTKAELKRSKTNQQWDRSVMYGRQSNETKAPYVTINQWNLSWELTANFWMNFSALFGVHLLCTYPTIASSDDGMVSACTKENSNKRLATCLCFSFSNLNKQRERKTNEFKSYVTSVLIYFAFCSSQLPRTLHWVSINVWNGALNIAPSS